MLPPISCEAHTVSLWFEQPSDMSEQVMDQDSFYPPVLITYKLHNESENTVRHHFIGCLGKI